MKEGDFIVAINDVDSKWSPHDEVVNLIKASGHDLRLKIVTPMPAPEVAQRNKQKVKETRTATTRTTYKLLDRNARG